MGASEIKLSRGKVSLIDDEDFDLVAEYGWRANQNQDGRWYAMAWDSYPNFILMHRLIMNPAPGMIVDHLDNDGLNNQRENLRVCTYSENVQRSGRKRQGSTSNFKGVHWESARNKWKAMIMKDGRHIYLGRYDSEVAAAEAYDDAVAYYHGEFGYRNFP